MKTIEWFGRDNRVVRIKSTNVHMSTTQIELLQSVYRTRKKLTRRGLAFWLLQQTGQGSLWIQHQLHHNEHMNACSATISVSGTRGLRITWMPAAPPFPFPEHVGWLRITCMPAAPPFPFPVHVGLRIMCMHASATISVSGTRGLAK